MVLLLLIVVLTSEDDTSPDDGVQVTMVAMPKPTLPPVLTHVPPMALMPRLAAQSLKLKLPPAIRFRLQEDSQAARAADNSLVQPGGSSAESASGAQAEANSDYLARLSRYIEAHSTKPKLDAGYPAFLESDVLLRLDGDGKLLSAEIRNGSSYQVVDDDALAQMRAIARFPPPPKAPYAVVIQWTVNKIPSLTDMRIIQTRAPNPAQQPPPADITLGTIN